VRPGQRRIEYVDKGRPRTYWKSGHQVAGVGTYYLRYKNAHGKTVATQEDRLDRGSDGAVSRREAKRIKAEVTLGADPRAEAKARTSRADVRHLL